uniref:2Fe-2S iron-sulfur cluster-binding protein n=1 Tax=Butyricicoccus sp. TaxID=2049021 RepID=UPI003D7D2A59
MNYTIRIKRQRSAQDTLYWQTFLCENEGNASVADVLRELNARTPLCDADGAPAQLIGWECSCLVRKCGACAMRINGIPRLACSVFLRDIKNATIVLEPLSKFPLVRDLIVDRRVLFDRLKEMQVWLEGEAQKNARTHAARYQSARCL